MRNWTGCLERDLEQDGLVIYMKKCLLIYTCIEEEIIKTQKQTESVN
jgi:hypothetical protein